VGDPAPEPGLAGELVVEVERVGVPACGGELAHVAVRDGLRELDAVADAQAVRVVFAQFDVPLRQVLVGLDPLRRIGNDAVLPRRD